MRYYWRILLCFKAKHQTLDFMNHISILPTLHNRIKDNILTVYICILTVNEHSPCQRCVGLVQPITGHLPLRYITIVDLSQCKCMCLLDYDIQLMWFEADNLAGVLMRWVQRNE